DPLAIASSRRQLGMLRYQLGRYAEAESLITASLVTYQGMTGDQDEWIVDALNNLGEIDRVQDHYDAAERDFRRGLERAQAKLPAGEALATAEHALGPDHPQVAQSLADLGRLLERRQGWAAAESCYRRALAIRAARLGAGHPDVAATHVDLARCLSLAPGHGAAAAAGELENAMTTLDASPVAPEARVEAH